MPARTLIEDLVIRYGFQVLGALVIMAVGFLIARWIDRLGFQIAPLVAGLGVAGIGLGFALQGVSSNVVAGLTIILARPFRVGEYITVAGVEGVVAHIDLPSTVLTHVDRSRVVVPNRKIVGEILHNFGMIRRLAIEIGVAHAADVAAALEAVREVLGRHPRVLKDPAPVFGVSAIADSTIRLTARPWAAVADAPAVEAGLYLALIEEFRARTIDMGVRRELRLVNGAAAAVPAAR